MSYLSHPIEQLLLFSKYLPNQDNYASLLPPAGKEEHTQSEILYEFPPIPALMQRTSSPRRRAQLTYRERWMTFD